MHMRTTAADYELEEDSNSHLFVDALLRPDMCMITGITVKGITPTAH